MNNQDLARLTQSQKAAYEALRPFCTGQPAKDTMQVLSGYAGTGKTTLACHLIQAACDAQLKVAVCAPTHKAVAVIAARIDPRQGAAPWIGTLHALLGLRLKEQGDGSLRLELDRRPRGTYFDAYDVVFVDEASMVGPALLAHIERATRKGRPRVLYIGDPGQLPPVTVRETQPARAAALWSETPTPPVFSGPHTRHHLREIVRQQSTGRPHPIVQFADAIRRHIDGEAEGVFDREAIVAHVTAHADTLGRAVRLASAHAMADGVVRLRQRRPDKDIRAVAWRNRAVEECNRFVHGGLASLYGHGEAVPGLAMAPFWTGEALVARETLYAFPPEADMPSRDMQSWERALAPADTLDNLVVLVANNTELAVCACEAMPHPYLDIPSWYVTATGPDGKSFHFFVADDPRAHQRLTRQAWNTYRANPERTPADFRRAWAVTRACAPVSHAYAVTAHKAQGSTFHYALIDIADLCRIIPVSGADEYHRALYVAVTRATERVWLCC
ncbi:MAG: AAA family ATPase [Gammaproteobacteria bacterium]|nr:AAA family ATPase [Gammaproteobacteria bacterium]